MLSRSFVEYVSPMRLDRAYAQEQALGDLLVRVAERDQSQHVALALREIVLGLAHHQPRRHRGLHVQPIGEDRAQGVGELLVGGVLEHVALRSLLQRAAGVHRLVLHREDDDPRARLPELWKDLQAGAVAQPDVEHDRVRCLATCHRERLARRRGLRDDVEPGIGQQPPNARAHDRVVVDEQEARPCGRHGR